LSNVGYSFKSRRRKRYGDVFSCKSAGEVSLQSKFGPVVFRPHWPPKRPLPQWFPLVFAPVATFVFPNRTTIFSLGYEFFSVFLTADEAIAGILYRLFSAPVCGFFVPTFLCRVCFGCFFGFSHFFHCFTEFPTVAVALFTRSPAYVSCLFTISFESFFPQAELLHYTFLTTGVS